MKVLSIAQMLAWENRVISQGISAEMLMEHAGQSAAVIIRCEFPTIARALVFVGKGHNGGDGLVVARALALAGWEIVVQLIVPQGELKELSARKLEELLRVSGTVRVTPSQEAVCWLPADSLIIDAMLGVGVSGRLRPELQSWVRQLNEARRRRYYRTVALDCPSGLEVASQSIEEARLAEHQAVVADLTLAMGFPKDFLLREELAPWVGRLMVVPLHELAPEQAVEEEFISPLDLSALLPRRLATAHKYNFGRVLILGGSTGMTGAPLLSAQGALRAGAGLVTVGVRSQIYSIVAGRAEPEVMVFDLGDEALFAQAMARATVVAVGPGLGLDQAAERLLRRIVERCDVPLIFDADALTLLAQDMSILGPVEGGMASLFRRQPMILTPHPGEMRRLIGRQFTEQERVPVAREFAQRHGVHLVLKGTRTVVAAPDGQVWINGTGNPGLACGGSGDCLTGIIAAVLAQGVRCPAALCLAVWWHGRAGDLAVRDQGGTEEGLSPQEVTRMLPRALADLRRTVVQE
jgi:ADP-dependent NAD(P)H-hydrate dehydratase / NAD(P)H-hydrate epimerase